MCVCGGGGGVIKQKNIHEINGTDQVLFQNIKRLPHQNKRKKYNKKVLDVEILSFAAQYKPRGFCLYIMKLN